MKLQLMTGVAFVATLFAAQAQAQDVSAPPAYGSMQLSSGFTPDPVSIGLRAGGAIDANQASDMCWGYITHQPSYNLTYEAGNAFDLYLSAVSDVDTVLVVNQPDGSWACNDDGDGIGLNAGVLIENPQSGLYNIWVGTYGSGVGYEPAMLHISELAFSTDNVYSRSPSADLAPEFGSTSLRADFRPDPRTFEVQAGGDVDLSRSSSCWGHADQAPDVWVDYQANGENRLYLSMESESDTTLMIEGPNGQMYCSDDEIGLNPGVRIDQPESGRYAIWAARYSTGADVPATIYVSELGYLGTVDTPPVFDYSLPSNYGSAALVAGFSPDPYNVSLQAGGDVPASEAVDPSCRGFATTAPDYDVTYTAGEFDLYISATADRDATLIVNAPDGSWWCDDDSAGDLNPGLVFDNPQSGRYDIWVGTYSEGPAADATLHISELGWGSEFMPSPQLDYSLDSNFGGIELSGGFTPDPYVVTLVAGGDIAAEEGADQSCRGYVTAAPDYELTFEPGALDLYISVLSDSDTTLVINDPSGNWVCNDDGSEGLNPGIHFTDPQEGVYDIWVGTYWEGDGAPAQLGISELGFLQPE